MIKSPNVCREIILILSTDADITKLNKKVVTFRFSWPSSMYRSHLIVTKAAFGGGFTMRIQLHNISILRTFGNSFEMRCLKIN